MASISQAIYPLVAGLEAVQWRWKWACRSFTLLERMPCDCSLQSRLGSLLRVSRFLSAVCLDFLYCRLVHESSGAMKERAPVAADGTKKRGKSEHVFQCRLLCLFFCFFYLAFPQMSRAVLRASLTPDPPHIRGHVFKI